MICVSIGDYGSDACKKALKRCERYRKEFPDLIAEIRLDLCGLSREEVNEIFSTAKIPLLATCMKRSSHLCSDAVMAGAAYVDINLFTYKSLKEEEKVLLKGKDTKILLSFHDYQKTPRLQELVSIYKEAVQAGADLVKIVTLANSAEDAETVLSLYGMQRQGKLGKKKIPLIAFAMGAAGRYSRLEAHVLGAPFLYCALKKKYILAPGMFTIEELEELAGRTRVQGEIHVPASKSVAQRAIIAAILAKGDSEFHNFSHCHDIDTAVAVAKQFSDSVYIDKDDLIVKGALHAEKKKETSPMDNLLSTIQLDLKKTIFVGESGLLSRLCIPIAAQFGESISITGEGSLLSRHMFGCKEALEEMGGTCVLTAEETLPAVVNGPLKGGNFTISGKKGSQFISGLLMALPISKKDSILRVEHPTSIPYLMLTVQTVKAFGIEISYVYEGEDLVFTIPGKQKYKPAEITFEGDWSSASNFIVMAAVFGEITLRGLNMESIQADRAIVDIIENCGANVCCREDRLTVSRGHLKAFECDVTNCPDLLPPLAVLAAFSEGTSRITGIARLKNKESDRPLSLMKVLKPMGVDIILNGDLLEIKGMSLFHRMIEEKMLQGGSFSSYGDHRVAMAIKIASLGINGKVSIDSTDCIAKSFPGFLQLFSSVIKTNR